MIAPLVVSNSSHLAVRTAVVLISVVVLGAMIYVSKSRKTELGDEIKKGEADRVSA